MVASPAPPTGDLSRNPGMCPDGESNRQPFGFWDNTNPRSHTGQGGLCSTRRPAVRRGFSGCMDLGCWLTGCVCRCFIRFPVGSFLVSEQLSGSPQPSFWGTNPIFDIPSKGCRHCGSFQLVRGPRPSASGVSLSLRGFQVSRVAQGGPPPGESYTSTSHARFHCWHRFRS